MNKIFRKELLTVVVATVLFSFVLTVNANESSRILPNINFKDLMGHTVNVQDLENDGKPIIISF